MIGIVKKQNRIFSPTVPERFQHNYGECQRFLRFLESFSHTAEQVRDRRPGATVDYSILFGMRI